MGQDGMIEFNRSLLRVGERVCCAVSGGADSIAMLLAASELNARKESLGVVLSAVHVHHGLRGEEADGDEAFVRNLCERLALPLTVFHVDTAARQVETREGVEEAARSLRYERLWRLLAERTADVVATAHTLDDQAETVILKMLRGAWTEGLSGISPVLESDSGHRVQAAAYRAADGMGQRPAPEPGRIIRPLLGVRRAEVETFLQARGQPWREDASNADLRFTRNRVRHELMPVLRGYNPGLDELLGRTAGIARDEEAFWTAEVARVLPGLMLPGKPVRGGGRSVGTGAGEKSFAIEVTRLGALPLALARRVLRAACRQGVGVHLSSEETARLMALAGFASHGATTAGSGTRIGARLELRAGLRVERSARELQFLGRFGVSENRPTEKEATP